MVDVSHYYEDGKLIVQGKVLNSVRVKPYLREMKFSPNGRSWVAYKTAEEFTAFLLWCGERGWTVSRMEDKPHAMSRRHIRMVAGCANTRPKKITPAKTNNVTYNYGYLKSLPNAQLRGGGLQYPQAKEYILSRGFRWVFSRGRRKVVAYEAAYTPHKLIEILLHLKMMGLNIIPSSSLHPKRWLYLDLPKVYEKQTIKTGNAITHESLAVWLEKNGYARIHFSEW